jgi:hypothetical protein
VLDQNFFLFPLFPFIYHITFSIHLSFLVKVIRYLILGLWTFRLALASQAQEKYEEPWDEVPLGFKITLSREIHFLFIIYQIRILKLLSCHKNWH